jgi:hypothetical protein
LVSVATYVYYNRDLEKEKDLEREKRKGKKQEGLIAVQKRFPWGRVHT